MARRAVGHSKTVANLVGSKYVFSLLVLAWAVSLLRWPRRAWLVAGPLVLAASSLLVLQKPLGRAYGVVEEGRGIAELGEVMVVAARGTASDGRMVSEPHPSPLWGYFVATLSGFRGERVLSLYPWLPLFSLLGLGVAVAWSVGRPPRIGGSPRGCASRCHRIRRPVLELASFELSPR